MVIKCFLMSFEDPYLWRYCQKNYTGIFCLLRTRDYIKCLVLQVVGALEKQSIDQGSVLSVKVDCHRRAIFTCERI